MSMELSRELSTHSSNGSGLSAEEAENRDTLYLMGGAALMVLGAGLILSTPMVRRMLGGVGVGNLISAAAPDFERYLKLRSM
jgi:hypothetical protein